MVLATSLSGRASFQQFRFNPTGRVSAEPVDQAALVVVSNNSGLTQPVGSSSTTPYHERVSAGKSTHPDFAVNKAGVFLNKEWLVASETLAQSGIDAIQRKNAAFSVLPDCVDFWALYCV